MNNIDYSSLDFEDKDAAKSFIIDNDILLFSDEGDIILCYQSNSENIKCNWSDITTQTALYFQSNLLDEVSASNLLLVFCSTDEIDIETRKKIQSDTYCCRKIARSNVSDIESSIKELVFYNTKNERKVSSLSLIELIKKKHPEVFDLMAVK
ncbi:ABC-three component system middle component 1 [Photobacterium sp. GSS17]|uniref:ABC-three component system middle component 1 n=1 Tax=Photobacterium sp. GSS17 TaxID=3020715 RepID=UPI00235EB75A|nr:ABC-three component system middle component 1 [Photobacterium sp. GSS17]